MGLARQIQYMGAAAIGLITAIYFTCRALTVHEPQKESDLELKQTAAVKALDRIASQITKPDHLEEVAAAASIQAWLHNWFAHYYSTSKFRNFHNN